MTTVVLRLLQLFEYMALLHPWSALWGGLSGTGASFLGRGWESWGCSARRGSRGSHQNIHIGEGRCKGDVPVFQQRCQVWKPGSERCSAGHSLLPLLCCLDRAFSVLLQPLVLCFVPPFPNCAWFPSVRTIPCCLVGSRHFSPSFSSCRKNNSHLGWERPLKII